MTKTRKHQIIGGIILLALLAIFLPSWLSHIKPLHTLTLDGEIPAEPTLPSLTVGPQLRSVSTTVTAPVVAAATSSESEWVSSALAAVSAGGADLSSPTAVPVSTSVTSLPSAAAWVIQLGSFKDILNAKAMVTRLKAQGYSAYYRLSDHGDVPLARVLIGPVTDSKKAAALQKRLQEEMDISGLLVRYQG